MAHLVSDAVFERLKMLAEPLLDAAREASVGQTIIPKDAPPEQAVVYDEVQSFTLAMMALVRNTALAEEPMFVAIGAAVGNILAQSQSPKDRAWLFVKMREQLHESYDEVVAATTPRGGVQ